MPAHTQERSKTASNRRKRRVPKRVPEGFQNLQNAPPPAGSGWLATRPRAFQNPFQQERNTPSPWPSKTCRTELSPSDGPTASAPMGLGSAAARSGQRQQGDREDGGG